MTYGIALCFIFLAAYGNAMTKRVYRREAMIADNKDVPKMSAAYRRTGTYLTVAGLGGLGVWFVIFVVGNPLALFATS